MCAKYLDVIELKYIKIAPDPTRIFFFLSNLCFISDKSCAVPVSFAASVYLLYHRNGVMEEAKEPVVLSADCICWRLEPPALSKSGGREGKMWMEARACQICCWLAPQTVTEVRPMLIRHLKRGLSFSQII